MMSNYYTTNLEDWVTRLYVSSKVFHPTQINKEDIARKLGIFLHKKPLPSYFEVVGRYRGITMDSKLMIVTN